MFRIVRQTPSKRLEVVCPNGDYLWPTPSQLADWTACPLCAMFTGQAMTQPLHAWVARPHGQGEWQYLLAANGRSWWAKTR
jgi:hypothetical protein